MKYVKLKLSVALMMCLLSCLTARSQDVAIKTNLLYDATATVNLGAEFGLSPKWTLDVSGNYNGWTFSDNKKWKHWLVQPEARYWFCNKMMGGFLGLHLLGGQYNIGNIDADFKLLGTDFGELKNHRYEGWMAGVGIAYGYSWALARHWNIEAEIGVGYVFSQYDKYECAKCGEKIESDKTHNYFGPTKLALNLIYVF